MGWNASFVVEVWHGHCVYIRAIRFFMLQARNQLATIYRHFSISNLYLC